MVLILSVTACGASATRPDAPPENEQVAIIPSLSDEQAAEQAKSLEMPAAPAEGEGRALNEVNPPQPESTQELLRYVHGFLALSRDAQRRIFGQVEGLYVKERTPQNLIRYGLVSAVAGSDRPAAVNRARSDLRAYVESRSAGVNDDDLVPLASLVLRILDDREQLTSELVAQNDILQKKIDELKAIEQQLLERSDSNQVNTP